MDKLTKITGGILLTLTFILPANASGNPANKPTVRLVSPTSSASYKLGDTIKMTASVSGATRPVYAYLIEVSKNQRIWIGRISLENGKTNYNLSYTIPDNFFEKNRLDPSATQFRIGLSTRAGYTFSRSLSRKRITIRPPTTEATPSAEPAIKQRPPEKPASTNTKPVILESLNIIDGIYTVATYEFSALYEPWVVRKLSIVNESQNDGFDYDPDEDTALIKRVIVSYKNSEGEVEQKSANFNVGRATINDLDFYIPRNGSAVITIKADVRSIRDLAPEFSGQTFRLGIQDANNNQSSFEAYGVVSGITDNSIGRVQINSGNVQEFIVHSNIISFDVVGNDSARLVGGENNVYEFTVSANAGTIVFARLVFDVTQSGISAVDQVSFWRGSSRLMAGDTNTERDIYLRWDAGTESCFAQDTQASGVGMNCAGGVAENAKLIVTFNNEEIITGGTSQKYKITLNTSGVDSGSLIAVSLATGDERALPSVGGAVGANGHIYNNGMGNELFSVDTDFVNEASDISDRNIIWSDRSNRVHRYPNVSAGTNPTIDNASSEDWTNGYLLKITALPRTILRR